MILDKVRMKVQNYVTRRLRKRPLFMTCGVWHHNVRWPGFTRSVVDRDGIVVSI